jgi:tetratricopeptide (TPR) repeat protein
MLSAVHRSPRSVRSRRQGVLAATVLVVGQLAHAHIGPEELQKELRAAVSRNPDDPAALLNLAKGHQTAGRWDDALVTFDEAIDHGADRDECDGGRGQVLLAAGMPRLAKRVFDQVLARRPDAYGIFFERGRAWMALGEPAKAADDYDRALAGLPRLTPEQVLIHRDALLAANKPAEALRALDQGMARLGPVASLQLAAIDMAAANRDWTGALDRLDQLLRQAPKSEAWIARRGDLLAELGRGVAARAEYDRALQLIAARPADRRPPALRDLEQRLRTQIEAAAAQPGASRTTHNKGDSPR